MAVAQIALGSNLGDRAENLVTAIRHLQSSISVISVSKPYENPAVGGPDDSPPFLNAAATIETDLTPRELLQRMHEVEARMGRRRRLKWEPRVIDLDLLLFADLIIDEPDLKVPHPLMHERLFVLVPLAEIAADAVQPVFRKTIGELLEILRTRSD